MLDARVRSRGPVVTLYNRFVCLRPLPAPAHFPALVHCTVQYFDFIENRCLYIIPRENTGPRKRNGNFQQTKVRPEFDWSITLQYTSMRIYIGSIV